MSLKARSERASASKPLNHLGSKGVNATLVLKDQIQRIVPPDELSSLVRESPTRARNEVRSACRQVFEAGSFSEVSAEVKEGLVSDLLDEIFGFGPLQGLLDDTEVTEIMVNGPFSLYYEKSGRLHKSDQAFSSSSQLRALIDRILGPIGRRVDESSPLVNARLPEGHRVHVVLPPLSLEGPLLTIRKFSERVITLEEMEERKSLDRTLCMFLEWMVRCRKSIAVSGGTGSGKTTLLNALSCKISQAERIITIEDSAELRFLEHPHVVRLEARPRNAEGFGEVSIRDLVINALRMRPDRIVVGECRGAEALDMLQAMNTGHDGSLTTLHANTPADAVSRLTTMVRYAVDLPVDVIEANVASAFDVVVQTARALDGERYVSEVAEFSFDEATHRCCVKTFFSRSSPEEQGVWHYVPDWIESVIDKGVATKEEVKLWKEALYLLD